MFHKNGDKDFLSSNILKSQDQTMMSEEPQVTDIDEDDSQIQKNVKQVQNHRKQKKILSMVPEEVEDKLNSMGELIGSFPEQEQ